MQWSSNKTRSKIRSEIIKNKLLPYMCDKCGISEWKGNSLSLHLDHINGINNDNRLDNLRFLCPNCHSQTDTYCGKANRLKYGYQIKKVSDEELIESIKCAKNIKESLESVGLTGAGNYARVKRLAIQNNLLHILEMSNQQKKNKEKVEKLRNSNIDFGKHGWVTKVSDIIEITPQKTRQFILRYAPDLLEKAYIRKTGPRM